MRARNSRENTGVNNPQPLRPVNPQRGVDSTAKVAGQHGRSAARVVVGVEAGPEGPLQLLVGDIRPETGLGHGLQLGHGLGGDEPVVEAQANLHHVTVEGVGAVAGVDLGGVPDGLGGGGDVAPAERLHDGDGEAAEGVGHEFVGGDVVLLEKADDAGELGVVSGTQRLVVGVGEAVGDGAVSDGVESVGVVWRNRGEAREGHSMNQGCSVRT